ncbi:MAG: alpha/beta hydrolase [Verrucomicrobia bacterium]|nr:alpha/beta hydrolase [Verrucomicrobiota bacterium]
MKNILLPFAALLAFTFCTRGEEPLTLKLWPDAPPLAVASDKPEAYLPPDGKSHPDITRLGNVSEPQLLVFPAPAGKRNGTAVLVCPGGGYSILAMKHEGTQVAEWLNSLGVTAAVLKYRVPAPKGEPPHLRPLLDAQRAMSLLRERAAEWGVDEQRAGVLGFSAGGNLAAWLVCEGNRRPDAYPDAAKEKPCRPDFGILLYSAYLTGQQTNRAVPVLRGEEKPGPVFLVHANDDRLTAENSAQFYLALKKAGAGAELHVYQDGGHGFGMLRNGQPVNDWPRRCEDWLRARKLIPAR